MRTIIQIIFLFIAATSTAIEQDINKITKQEIVTVEDEDGVYRLKFNNGHYFFDGIIEITFVSKFRTYDR